MPRSRSSNPTSPIVRLGARQALLAYATAVVGAAREHAKWQVAQGVGMFPRPHVKIAKKSDCTDACLKRTAGSCPVNILEFAGGKLSVTDELKCIDCGACEKTCEHGSIKITPDTEDFFLRFETDGSLTAREALRYSLKDLKRRFEELREAIQAIPSGAARARPVVPQDRSDRLRPASLVPLSPPSRTMKRRARGLPGRRSSTSDHVGVGEERLGDEERLDRARLDRLRDLGATDRPPGCRRRGSARAARRTPPPRRPRCPEGPRSRART